LKLLVSFGGGLRGWNHLKVKKFHPLPIGISLQRETSNSFPYELKTIFCLKPEPITPARRGAGGKAKRAKKTTNENLSSAVLKHIF